jgi:hypothetical protein
MCVFLASNFSAVDPSVEMLKIGLPSLLVVAGWVVAYFLQNRMAHNLQSRKDVRDGLTLLKSSIKDFNDCCVEYYTVIEKSYLSVRITSDFDAITKDILRATKSLPVDSSRIELMLAEISMALTGGDFQTKIRSRRSLPDSSFSYSANRFNLILSTLEEGYHKKYPNS